MRILITAAAILLLACYSEFEQPRRETTPQKVKASSPAGKTKKKDKKKPEQSYRQAWEVICHAERRAGIDPALDRQERGSLVAGWLVEHLRNKKARYWLIHFGDIKEAAERRDMLRAEVEKVGIARCPLEALLFPPPDAGPVK